MRCDDALPLLSAALDEPLSALDVKVRERLRREIKAARDLKSQLEALEGRTVPSATLHLSGAQTLVPGANVNVSNNANTTESEMQIAINPSDPLQVAGFTHNLADPNEISLYHTWDGGLTWERTVIDDASDGLGQGVRFLVVSTPFPFEAHISDLTLVNYYADPEEWFFLLKVPGLWRVMFPTRPEESEAEIFDPEHIDQRLQRVLPMAERYPVRHTTLYRVHQRVAKDYGRGRVFLAGDAAHINNPLGGMGMNGGIHDALNIAEKLVRVRLGEAPALLDAYEAERRPIALDYVNTITIRNKRNLEASDPAEQQAFRDFLAEMKSDPAKERDYLLRVSMIASLRRVVSDS